jgi:transcriptional regulator with XRE-family HTH domain
MNETLGQRISRLRTERGMSQGDLADALEISRQSVSKWETDTSTPELDKLIRLAELFDISMDALVLGKEDTPSQPIETPEPPPAAEHTSESIKLGYRKPPISQTQKNVGLGLIGISVLFCMLLLVFYAWGGLLTGLMLSSPLWGCGILCLTVRKRLGLCCLWMIYACFGSYLLYASNTYWKQILTVFMRVNDNPVRNIMIIVEFLLFAAMVFFTLYALRNSRFPLHLPLKSQAWSYFGFFIGYVIYYLLLEWLVPQYILSQVTETENGIRILMHPWYRIYSCTVNIGDSVWLILLILGARLLYNEHKAAKTKT